MKFVVYERSYINRIQDVGVLGIFTSWDQACSAIKLKRLKMIDMFGIAKFFLDHPERARLFSFDGENGEKVSWRIDKRVKL